MSAQVLTLESAKQANLSVVEDGRGTQAVHDHVVAMQANRRAGTACAKTRGEVRGNNKMVAAERVERKASRLVAHVQAKGVIEPACRFKVGHFQAEVID